MIQHDNVIFTLCAGVAPFPGATTGTGGRIRDVQATGRGAHVIAGTAGYSFGNLHIPGMYRNRESNCVNGGPGKEIISTVYSCHTVTNFEL